MKTIEMYVTVEGVAPFPEWITSLKEATIRARLENRIKRLKLGNFGDCESVGEGVLELRFFFGPGFRVYFAEYGGCIILLLCGGDKHIRKSEISKKQKPIGKNLRREFKERIQ